MNPEERAKSRSQRRREYLELHAVGEALVRLSPGHFARMPLDESLRAAVVEARRLDGGAYRRQLRLVARLVSRGDAESIRAAMDFVSDAGPAAGARRRLLEARRDRLLEGGDDAIQALIEERPEADRPRLRRLVREARAERDAGDSGGRASRALVAYLRELEHSAMSRGFSPTPDEA